MTAKHLLIIYSLSVHNLKILHIENKELKLDLLKEYESLKAVSRKTLKNEQNEI